MRFPVNKVCDFVRHTPYMKDDLGSTVVQCKNKIIETY